MDSNGLLDSRTTSCFVTCGDWDLKTMLPGQCKYLNIPVPNYYHQWINIKTIFRDLTGQEPSGMPGMLEHFKLTLEGKHHSGIDDSRNIAKILAKLAEIQPNIQPTTTRPTFRQN